jgi:heme oxygenase
MSFDDRFKNKILKKDLCLLGLKPEHFTQLKYCSDLPTLINEGQLLGYFYVMEGATLGGQILLPIIDKIFSPSARKANLYFSGYGDNTRTKWQEFSDHLNKYSKNHHVVLDAIDTAIATFTSFDKWLSLQSEEFIT